MPRNAEVIRQWTILREIERARASGTTIDDLASLCGVTTRTIRRDLEALEQAGFPLFDDRSGDDGRTRWRINGQAFKSLAAGLTLSELCALYFSRTLVESLAATPFGAGVEQAFEKLSSALTPHMRQFLDRLPRIMATKAEPVSRPLGTASHAGRSMLSRLLEATLQSRQAILVYHSRASERTKPYLVHPYRLAYAKGSMYVLGYVPEYGEIRTFALDRIEDVSLLEERFTPVEELPDAAFPHSLGVHSGPPERVEVSFTRGAADYVRTREWHDSQKVRDAPDGGIVMTLNVCVDQALESWILGFGESARVLFPDSLARAIAEAHARAAAVYGRI